MPAAARKITVEVPAELLSKAQKASGAGASSMISAALADLEALAIEALKALVSAQHSEVLEH